MPLLLNVVCLALALSVVWLDAQQSDGSMLRLTARVVWLISFAAAVMRAQLRINRLSRQGVSLDDPALRAASDLLFLMPMMILLSVLLFLPD